MESSPDRRGLLRLLALVFGGVCGGAGLGTLLDPLRSRDSNWIALAPLAELEPGAAKRVRMPVRAGWEVTERPIYLLRAPNEGGRAEGEAVIAFDARCTHLGCTVRFKERQFVCPCHRGVFDADGNPVSGPVEKPLAKIEVRVRNGIVEGRA